MIDHQRVTEIQDILWDLCKLDGAEFMIGNVVGYLFKQGYTKAEILFAIEEMEEIIERWTK